MLATAGVLALSYGPRVGTSFSSEDFLILSHLARTSPLDVLIEGLRAPWLGLDTVGFYRPFSTFLLALELHLWGLRPELFHASHVAIHGLNTLLFGLLLSRLLPRLPAWSSVVAASLFAIHPFHPSAVLFTGAFATLFGATFTLLALLFFVEGQSETGGFRQPLSVGLFAVALGCYEAAAVLPIVVMTAAALLPHPPRFRRLGWIVRSSWPYGIVLLTWLALRASVLGAMIGGYDSFRQRFAGPVRGLVSDLSMNVVQIFHPAIAAYSPSHYWVRLWLIILALATSAAGLWALRRGGRKSLAVFAFGAAWAALSLSPFSFVGLVPANGRYAYFAVAGLLVALLALIEAVNHQGSRAVGRLLLTLWPLTLGAMWLSTLGLHLRAYEDANDQILLVRSELAAVATSFPPDATVLISGHPDFVHSPTGVPLGKVFQYGLAESVSPPFGQVSATLIALPSTVEAPTAELLSPLPSTMHLSWDSVQRKFVKEKPGDRPTPILLSLAVRDGKIRVGCTVCRDLTLVVATPGLTLIDSIGSSGLDRGFILPSPRLLEGASNRDSESVLWWIEEREESRIIAMSEVRELTLEADPLADFLASAVSIRPAQ